MQLPPPNAATWKQLREGTGTDELTLLGSGASAHVFLLRGNKEVLKVLRSDVDTEGINNPKRAIDLLEKIGTFKPHTCRVVNEYSYTAPFLEQAKNMPEKECLNKILKKIMDIFVETGYVIVDGLNLDNYREGFTLVDVGEAILLSSPRSRTRMLGSDCESFDKNILGWFQGKIVGTEPDKKMSPYRLILALLFVSYHQFKDSDITNNVKFLLHPTCIGLVKEMSQCVLKNQLSKEKSAEIVADIKTLQKLCKSVKAFQDNSMIKDIFIGEILSLLETRIDHATINAIAAQAIVADKPHCKDIKECIACCITAAQELKEDLGGCLSCA